VSAEEHESQTKPSQGGGATTGHGKAESIMARDTDARSPIPARSSSADRTQTSANAEPGLVSLISNWWFELLLVLVLCGAVGYFLVPEQPTLVSAGCQAPNGQVLRESLCSTGEFVPLLDVGNDEGAQLVERIKVALLLWLGISVPALLALIAARLKARAVQSSAKAPNQRSND
jgi:hypothetical protein